MGESRQLPGRGGRGGWGLRLGVLALLAVVVAAVGLALGWFSAQPKRVREQSGVLMHLDSRVGAPAPAFTLTDSEGVAHTVTPGQGRPTVLLFHMGTR